MTTLTAEPYLIDTRDMTAVHTIFRREFGLAADLVRRVPAGDLDRARTVDAHLELIGRVLHHHHEAEDDYLWPLLLQRVPDELEPIVLLMEEHHQRIGAVLTRIEQLRPYWVVAPTAARTAELAALYEEHHAVLLEHLDAEENELLPIAARSLTQLEWHGLGERAMAGNSRSDMPLIFGMLAYGADPVVLAGMVANAPLLLRLLVPTLGRRAFRKHALRVHGTSTP